MVSGVEVCWADYNSILFYILYIGFRKISLHLLSISYYSPKWYMLCAHPTFYQYKDSLLAHQMKREESIGR